jgi:hypothetical protein
VPPVSVMHRSRVRRAHRVIKRLKAKIERIAFLQSTNRPRCACLGKAQATPSQQIAATGTFQHGIDSMQQVRICRPNHRLRSASLLP